jgi:hypothetical protein
MNRGEGFDFFRRAVALWRPLWTSVSNAKTRHDIVASIWRRLVENRVPVFVSLILATLIYYGIHDRPTEAFVRNVAVKERGAPEGSRIGIEPPTVRVVFKGLREDMLGLDMAPPVIFVSYPGDQALKDGQAHVVKIKARDVRLPKIRGFGSVSVERLDPERVTLVKDETASMGFDIELPKLEGVPSGGYRAEVIDYSPKRAAVTGGGSRLRRWDALGHRLQLAPVSVDGLGLGEFTRLAEILPPKGEDAMDVVLPTEKVEVKVRVLPQRDSRTLEGIPVRLSFPQGTAFPRGVMVEPASVSVTLVGAKEQLRDVTAGSVVVYAEVPADAPPLSATNVLAVALVARIPQDKSIYEVNLVPPAVALTAVAPEEVETEVEVVGKEGEAGTSVEDAASGMEAADATPSLPDPSVPNVPEESVEP